MGDKRWETGEGRQEKGDRKQEKGDRRREAGDRRRETGDGSLTSYKMSDFNLAGEFYQFFKNANRLSKQDTSGSR